MLIYDFHQHPTAPRQLDYLSTSFHLFIRNIIYEML